MVIDDSIKVISIDLDDTLWDNRPVLENAENQLYKWLKENAPVLTDQYSLQDLKIHRKKLVEQNPGLRHDLTKQRFLSLSVVLETVGLDKSKAFKAMEIFLEARSEVELYDDVMPMLQRLCKKYMLISVTNGNSDIYKIGLDKYFSHAFSPSEIGVSKPDPMVFDYILKKLNISTKNIIHIGDEPATDIIGAKEAGIKNIWINRKKEKWPGLLPKPDMEIESLDELLFM